MKSHFIFYVSNQARSAEFYAKVLEKEPDLNVPGMTEFHLSPTSVLGLMPEAGISKLLGESVVPLSTAPKVPRAELYLLVSNSDEAHARAIRSGAVEISCPVIRDWGHRVGYVLDPDGHIVAFAEAIKETRLP
jgi:catechol 2,3-dioxygenase-like lactoylglutathione lyase family enzyme